MKSFILLALLLTVAQLQVVTVINRGCRTYNDQQVCVECSTRYYLDSNAICQPVNPNCKDYNKNTGACTSCYPGFGLLEDTCLPGFGGANNFDPNCNKFEGDICVKCSVRYFLGQDGKCKNVDPSCRDYDERNGDCTSCYSGYEVRGGKCLAAQAQPAIANCNQIDSLTGRCIKCSENQFKKDKERTNISF